MASDLLGSSDHSQHSFSGLKASPQARFRDRQKVLLVPPEPTAAPAPPALCPHAKSPGRPSGRSPAGQSTLQSDLSAISKRLAPPGGGLAPHPPRGDRISGTAASRTALEQRP